MSFTTSQSTSTDRLISETNNKLKQGFHNLCCKLDSSNSTYTFTPVYVYRKLYGTNFTENPIAHLAITNNTTNVEFAYHPEVENMCNDFEGVSDSICTFIFEDSTGYKHFEGANGTFIRDYTDLLTLYSTSQKTINFKVTIVRTSGFQQVNIGTITFDTEEITEIEITDSYTNTNVSNIDTIALAGLIPTPYEVMVADILEVSQNGTFLKYVDLDNNDYTIPDGVCLSYNPVMPFTELADITIPVTYDTITRYSITNGSEVFTQNTMHKISYSVISGDGDIEVDSSTISVPTGFNETLEATTLLNKTVTITSPDLGTTIIVTTTTI